jgi:hypothetical protein
MLITELGPRGRVYRNALTAFLGPACAMKEKDE